MNPPQRPTGPSFRRARPAFARGFPASNPPADFAAPARTNIWRLAASIVERCDAEHPADEVLRTMLRSRPGLTRTDAREVSRAVFAFFRWRAWTPRDKPMETRLHQTVELAGGFAFDPSCVSDAELLAKVVPPWTAEHCELSPAWLRALQSEPALWLRARRGQGAELARQLDGAVAERLPDAVRYTGETDLFRHPLFQAGDFEIQDVASQAVGLACAPVGGQTWWDACAGQGGKLLHLSDLLENKGLIWATDRAEWRLKQLRQRAARARCFNYRAVPWDGGSHLPTRTKFDGVLVDAPCSGLGTWSRNPHARWNTTPEDVRELAQVQRDLLAHCAPAVKPGGRLIYSVCTLTRDETVAVCDAFAAGHPQFVPCPMANPFVRQRPPQARHLWWPQDTGGNGMFVAAWQRAG